MTHKTYRTIFRTAMLSLLVSMAAACNNNEPEVVVVDGDKSIEFNIATASSVTRADGVDEDLAVLKEAGFGVYCTKLGKSDESRKELFVNVKVEWNESDNDWYYSPYKYWNNGTHYDFCAYSPYHASDGTNPPTWGKDANGNDALSLSIPQWQTDHDYMISDNVVDKTYPSNDFTEDRVHLTFRHILSKLILKASTSSEADNTITYKITSVQIGEGTAEAENRTFTRVMLDVDNKNTFTAKTKDFAIFSGEATVTSGELTKGYVIPYSQDGNILIKVAYTETVGGQTTEKSGVATLSIKAFEANTIYTINLQLGGKVVEAEVTSIQGWDDVTVDHPVHNW